MKIKLLDKEVAIGDRLLGKSGKYLYELFVKEFNATNEAVKLEYSSSCGKGTWYSIADLTSSFDSLEILPPLQEGEAQKDKEESDEL